MKKETVSGVIDTETILLTSYQLQRISWIYNKININENKLLPVFVWNYWGKVRNISVKIRDVALESNLALFRSVNLFAILFSYVFIMYEKYKQVYICHIINESTNCEWIIQFYMQISSNLQWLKNTIYLSLWGLRFEFKITVQLLYLSFFHNLKPKILLWDMYVTQILLEISMFRRMSKIKA